MMKQKDRFVLCIESGDYEASLEPRKVYRVVDDPASEAKGLLRVIDESGEDYLFPRDLFVPIEVPTKATSAFVTNTPESRQDEHTILAPASIRVHSRDTSTISFTDALNSRYAGEHL
jgi:hypothetical protein